MDIIVNVSYCPLLRTCSLEYMLWCIVFDERNILCFRSLPVCWHPCVIHPERSLGKGLYKDPFIYIKIKLHRKREHPWISGTLESGVFRKACSSSFAAIFNSITFARRHTMRDILGVKFEYLRWSKMHDGYPISECQYWPRERPIQKGGAVVKWLSPLRSALWLKDIVQQLWVYKMSHTESCSLASLHKPV